jgi:hypothetical protein
MFRRNTESLNDVLLRSLRQLGLETPLLQKRLIDSWPVVAGEIVSRYTTEIYIRNQTLVVHLNNSALRADLMMQRTRLVKELNHVVRTTMITDIQLR